MTTALYVLPYPRFFTQHAGVGGHIAHANGVLSALKFNGVTTHVVAEEWHSTLAVGSNHVHVLPARGGGLLGRQRWHRHLIQEISGLVKREKPTFIYMRYSAGFAPWIPFMRWVTGTRLVLEVNSLGSQWHRLMRGIDRWALTAADDIVVVSPQLYDFVDQVLGLQNTERVHVMPNAVDPLRFDGTPADSELKDQSVRVCYAGLLKPEYGLESLIEAAKILANHVPPIEVNIVGDGPFRAEIEKLAVGLHNVVIHGPVEFDEMPAVLHGMDVLVHTTSNRNSYQSPTKIYEYMAAGRAIVAALTRQTSELITHGKTGILYETGSTAELVAAITKLAGDPALRRLLGTSARREVCENHTWNARVKVLLRKILSGDGDDERH